MTLPVDWTLVSVTGTYCNSDGSPAVGRIYFYSSQVVVVDGVTVVPKVQYADLDSNGSFSIPLPSTNDPDLSNGDWTYQVVEQITNGRTPYNVAIPYNAGTVDLSSLAPVLDPPDAMQLATVARTGNYNDLADKPDSSSAEKFSTTSGMAINSGSVVCMRASQAFNPDLTNPSDVQSIVGIAFTSTSGANQSIDVLPGGTMTESGWNWSAGRIYCDLAGGTLTQTAPTAGAIIEVAKAITPNTIEVGIGPAILRS